MPSVSPSSAKRPSLTERTSSAHSLSSSGRQPSTHGAHKPHRSHTHHTHVVGRHSRNVSHGKGLSKLGRVQSSHNVTSEDGQHARKKSGGTTPPASPRVPLVKRNSSHVSLPKNTSQGNLRKNHSASALARNLSHPTLKKAGLAPAPQRKAKEHKDGVFQLGDRSSDDEEEGEWEDSTNQSPEVTRNNSKTATPRPGTPDGYAHVPPSRDSATPPTEPMPTSASSPPPRSSRGTVRSNHRSAPNLRRDSSLSPSQVPPDPALLHQNARGSRAPPAMSTVSARASVPSHMPRSDSSRSFTHISHADADGHGHGHATSTAPVMNVTPVVSGTGSSAMAAASSAEAGVSHFLPIDGARTPGSSQPRSEFSDDDSPSSFFSTYKPQPSESPDKTRTGARPKSTVKPSHHPSRTQQRLELQRREMMRAGAATPTTPSPGSMSLTLGSSTSLHGRAHSRNRNRSLAGGRGLAGEMKVVKQDYDTAVKQLLVVRRFRSPLVESLTRLKDKQVLAATVGAPPAGGGLFSKDRPPSRPGLRATGSVAGAGKAGMSRSLEERKTSPLASRSSSRGRGSRVHFHRQGSHDDIEVTPSPASPDDGPDDDTDGLSPEESLLRRMWNSREVYEAAESLPVR